ncbi:MAG: nucleoside deaminase [Geminicoccaceae bacterium]
MSDRSHMRRALELARRNVAEGGWPFSAVIVRAGAVVSEGVNTVQKTLDPSNHAEMTAIRAATTGLGTLDLSGCEMYVGLPCPMCMTCILVSKIDRVIFAVDAAAKDKALSALPSTSELYHVLGRNFSEMGPDFVHLDEFSDAGVGIFKAWNDKTRQ